MSEQTSDLQNAMEVFQEGLPRIKSILATMDRNTMSRVFLAAVSYPFMKNIPVTKNRLEQELFLIAVATLSAKNIIMSQVSKDEVEKQTVDNTVNEIKEELHERNETMDQGGEFEHQSTGQEGQVLHQGS